MNDVCWTKMQENGMYGNHLSNAQKKRRRRHIKTVNAALHLIRSHGEQGINIKDMPQRFPRELGYPSAIQLGNHLAALRRRIPDAIERVFRSLNGHMETYYVWVADEETETQLNRLYDYHGNEEVETDA